MIRFALLVAALALPCAAVASPGPARLDQVVRNMPAPGLGSLLRQRAQVVDAVDRLTERLGVEAPLVEEPPIVLARVDRR
jgi:hypothetical protein